MFFFADLGMMPEADYEIGQLDSVFACTFVEPFCLRESRNPELQALSPKHEVQNSNHQI